LKQLSEIGPDRVKTQKLHQAREFQICAWAANKWSHQALVAGFDLGFELESAPVNGQAILLQEFYQI
jgi:hypothetical protein